MRQLVYFSLLLLVLNFEFVQAQTVDNKKVKRYSDLSIVVSSLSYRKMGKNTMNAAVAEVPWYSSYVQQIEKGAVTRRYPNERGNSLAIQRSWQLGLQSTPEGDPCYLFRAGFSYASVYAYKSNRYLRLNERIDTLVDASNTSLWVDTSETLNYKTDMYTRMVSTDFSLHKWISLPPRFVMTAGIGFSMGMVLPTKVEMKKEQYNSRIAYPANASNTSDRIVPTTLGPVQEDKKAQSVTLSRGWFSSVLVPVSIRFKLSQKENVLARMSLALEYTLRWNVRIQEKSLDAGHGHAMGLGIIFRT
ncbi:MAG: hypothetical protein MUF42_12585 [Cytophagaceae bacterium]|jgi:hypothetical protein|nr:hypothetical protein [Cytophagaceae bacterium]